MAIYIRDAASGPDNARVLDGAAGESGVAIFPPIAPLSPAEDSTDPDYTAWALYADDGRGNGDFYAYAVDETTAIACARGLILAWKGGR